ncbi:MAG: hypothetical protein HYV27_09685 [Candidatus Hydrogenedentes bacterium]|nr:hypothetical protein [Candidatus Hydrogenedentota bacterium]
MAAKPKKFPGGLNPYALKRGARYTLELAEDYLLSRERKGYIDHVRRYFLDEIEMITIEKTRRGLYAAGLTAAAGLLMILVATAGVYFPQYSPLPDSSINVIAAAIGVFALLVCMMNLFLGPTCKTVLYTAVHEEHLKSLDRVRRANRALNRLMPLIQEAQRNRSATGERSLAGRKCALPQGAGTPKPADTGLLHLGYFAGVLLLAVVIVLLDLPQMENNPIAERAINVVTALMTVTLLWSATGLQIRHFTRPVSRAIRVLVAATLVALVPLFYLLSMVQAGTSQEGAAMPIDPIAVALAAWTFFGVFTVLGLAGLMTVFFHRRSLSAVASTGATMAST